MKLVLMVEGVACKVLELDFNQEGNPYRVKAIVNGEIKSFCETNDECHPSRYDIKNNLVYRNRYDELFESMNNLREELSDKMKLLGLEYIREDIPTQRMLIKQKFEAAEQRAIALEEALDLVAEYMYKDVLK